MAAVPEAIEKDIEKKIWSSRANIILPINGPKVYEISKISGQPNDPIYLKISNIAVFFDISRNIGQPNGP